MNSRVRWALGALVLALVAVGLGQLRVGTIRRFFPDAEPGPAPTLTRGDGPPAPPAQFVRVVLIDGLGADVARGLPNLDDACATGLDLTVDVGFPTVSLPVQHVLWTGRTQQQSGIQYRIERLPEPPPDALPLHVPGSVAVAESHRDIVHSFGFERALPPLQEAEVEGAGSAWGAGQFEWAAEAAVNSDDALVFVHVLRVDEAGHAHGARSPEYEQAARWADDLLGVLRAADPAPGHTRWFVLSDHGHRPAGGHGDAEAQIRLVRGCIFGDVNGPRAGGSIHLVDLHRALADALGAGPRPDSAGRTLGDALAFPDPAATLPWPGPGRWWVGGLIALAGLAWAARACWRLRSAVWLWLPLAYATTVAVWGWPTLSNPVVFPPLGRDVLWASVPGFVWLAWGSWVLSRRASVGAVAALALAGPVALWSGLAVIAGVFRALLGGPPPLVPWISGQACALTTMVAGGCVVVAAVLAVRTGVGD